ncbi:MAG: M23 family metallopeptidase [Alphaproteobacteria bacterium]
MEAPQVPQAPQAAPAPSLSLPIDCVPGKTCWISKFVDLDPGPGVLDYMCAGRANDRHSGVDIAIRDVSAMEAGISVLAAAPGVVTEARDGLPDVRVKVPGAEMVDGTGCGNGVAIAHGGGWFTHYCHMRQGSIAVKTGDRVEAGQKLGQVGISGMSEYPHVHFMVRHGDTIVDPFLGVEGRPRGASCGLGTHPLWTEAALKALVYTPAAIFNAGFSSTMPARDQARAGGFRDFALQRNAPTFFFWADLFGVEAGDELRMRLVDPDGKPLIQIKKTLEQRDARWFQYIGKRRRGAPWRAGTYRGEVTLTGTRDGKTMETSDMRLLEVR